MERVDFRVKCVLRFEPSATPRYADVVQVAVSCVACRRNDRTVSFDPRGAVCVKHQHPFDGRLEDLRVEVKSGLSVATYTVAYEYDDFVDAKDHERSRRYPSWGRVAFDVACGGCGAVSSRGTQTNLTRPCDADCACGARLYQETGQLPLFECWPCGR